MCKELWRSEIGLACSAEKSETSISSPGRLDTMAGKRILILCTSHDQLLGGDPTGLWAEELIAPYNLFTKAGAHVDIISVKGGRIPLDANSLAEGFVTPEVKTFLGAENLKHLVENTKPVSEYKDAAQSYDALYLPGGHGACFDIASDKTCIALVESFWAANKVVSAVCHGPCGLVEAKQPNGDPIVKDKRVCGFTNSEEEAVGKTKKVPFLLEDKLIELGGKYEKVANWEPFTIRDGQLVTGQNPGSSEKLAELVLEALGA
ncbi:hypothetical protein R1flu_002653 [Riccia fluitans]|uniref:DJ-1/PfpI domain-containing protein n=1 Tax=Riccia fluitans TaxID=41844 RepID=A0ABD1Y6Q6_9MARC